MTRSHAFRVTDPAQLARRLPTLARPRPDATLPFVVILVGGSDGQLVSDITVEDCDPDPSPTDCALVLDAALEQHACPRDAAVLVLGLSRPGPLTVQPFDRAWFRALHRVCHGRGFTSGGVYVVGPLGVRALHVDDAA